MTTLTAPIAKLYKRCARNHHDSCPGSFETWSLCSCDCHAGVSDERPAPANESWCRDCRHSNHAECHSPNCPCPCTTMPAPAPETPVTCADKHEAVAEAIAIVTPKPARKAPKSSKGVRIPRGSYKCYGHHAWADAEHPSGGEGTGPIDTRIFVNVISAALQAQLDTLAKKGR